MAITVVSAPATTVRGGDKCLKFTFDIDDTGDGINTSIGMRYQVYWNGAKIGLERTFYPVATGEFDLDIYEEFAAGIGVNYPNFNTGFATFGMPDMSGLIKIEYWEVTIDLVQCVPVAAGSKEMTSEFRVLNSASQWWSESLLTTGVYTDMPDCIEIDSFAEYFITIKAGTTITRIDTYADGFTSTFFNTVTENNSQFLNSFGCGPKNIWGTSVPSELEYYDIIIDADEERTFRFKVKCRSSELIRNVTFLSHQGSWHTMSFCWLDEVGFDTELKTTAKYEDCKRPDQLVSKLFPSNRIQSKEGKEIITLGLEMERDRQNLRWINNFLASKVYFLQDRSYDGTLTYVSFIVTSSNVQTYKVDDVTMLAVQGYINQRYNMPVVH